MLLPSFEELLPAGCVPIVQSIASTKESEQEIFDILELAPESGNSKLSQDVSEALKETSEAPKIEYKKASTDGSPIESITDVSLTADLLIMGAKRPQPESTFLSFGDLQNNIINSIKKDIFVVIEGNRLIARQIKRIIVPVNGMEYSTAAADIAAYIAKATDAEVTFFNAVKGNPLNQKDLAYHRLRRTGYKVLQESKFRTKRLDIRYKEIVVIAEDIEKQIVDEIQHNYYDLLVFGVVDRSNEAGLQLGSNTRAILTQTNIPTGMLIICQKAEVSKN